MCDLSPLTFGGIISKSFRPTLMGVPYFMRKGVTCDQKVVFCYRSWADNFLRTEADLKQDIRIVYLMDWFNRKTQKNRSEPMTEERNESMLVTYLA